MPSALQALLGDKKDSFEAEGDPVRIVSQRASCTAATVPLLLRAAAALKTGGALLLPLPHHSALIANMWFVAAPPACRAQTATHRTTSASTRRPPLPLRRPSAHFCGGSCAGRRKQSLRHLWTRRHIHRIGLQGPSKHVLCLRNAIPRSQD